EETVKVGGCIRMEFGVEKNKDKDNSIKKKKIVSEQALKFVVSFGQVEKRV
ncbi:15193_t:CDS:1, partial [Gigaspora rosea]